MLGLVGISYKSAPLEIREKFAFTGEESLDFLRQLKIDPDLKGAVVLSTCNRIEIYFHFETCCSDKAWDAIFRNLEFFKKSSPDQRKYFYSIEGDAATEHLFRVVSGLESLVIGEDQIVTQVKSGFLLSLDNDHSSSVLTRMFNKAFEAGKRVRTETAINKGSASISSAAVELICQRTEDISNKKITLIGTGIMGELAVVNLVKRNCCQLYITNRTYSKALELAEKHNITAFELEKLNEFLPQSDIIMVATGAQNHIITKDMVEKFVSARSNHQLYMDLSVPRNISTEILQLPNVELFAVDDLQEIVKETQNKRKEAISEAMEIIRFVKQEFNDWLNALELTPSIMKIQKNMEAVNNTELEGFLRINGISENEMIARYAEHISRKYTRLFIRNLKQVTNNGKQREFINVVNQLFELQDNNEA
ncbi:MAG: glutamyl-tRNA reductase [Bacteroidales bacterium]|nr:glutamyl-tRNA reductase [Bacteroidales bacterium]